MGYTPSVCRKQVRDPKWILETCLQLNLWLDDGEKVSVGNIVTKIKELMLEQKATEAVIEKIGMELVEKHCGEKYAHVIAVSIIKELDL